MSDARATSRSAPSRRVRCAAPARPSPLGRRRYPHAGVIGARSGRGDASWLAAEHRRDRDSAVASRVAGDPTTRAPATTVPATTRSATCRCSATWPRRSPGRVRSTGMRRDSSRRSRRRAATAESNVDPAVRIAFDDLARDRRDARARRHRARRARSAALELDDARACGRRRTLEAYRPLFTELAVSLGQRPASRRATTSGADDDPMMAMMAGLSQMMAPSMMGMAIGSMVGRLATRAFGQYDLPIPRRRDHRAAARPVHDRCASPPTGACPVDEMRLWVLAQELIGHAVFSHAPVRDAITALVQRHVGAFRPDPAGVADKLSSLDVDDGDPIAGGAEGARPIRRCCSAPCGRPSRSQMAPRARRGDRGGRRLRRLHGRRGRGAGDRWRRAADRRGGPPAARRGERRRTCSSSACSGCRSPHALVQRGKTFIGGVVDRVGEARARSAVHGRPTDFRRRPSSDAPGLCWARRRRSTAVPVPPAADAPASARAGVDRPVTARAGARCRLRRPERARAPRLPTGAAAEEVASTAATVAMIPTIRKPSRPGTVEAAPG